MFNICVFRFKFLSLEDFIFKVSNLKGLKDLAFKGYNIFISGEILSGKISLLNVFLDCVNKDERVVSVEDS